MFQTEYLYGRDQYRDITSDGRILLKSILKVGYEGVDRIKVAQDRAR
jgi:hypothetical protein